MIHHFLTRLAIAVVLLFVLASDLKSLATYFGLLSAGLLRALQNVILASLDSLLLVGQRGIRTGDRVQVSGITGEVMNMGMLQFQLREFDVQRLRFTGHVATFSNSLGYRIPSYWSAEVKFSSWEGCRRCRETTMAQNRMRRCTGWLGQARASELDNSAATSARLT